MMIDPSNVRGQTLYNMGTAYAEMERFPDAIKCYEQSIPRGLSDAEVKRAKEQIRRCTILEKRTKEETCSSLKRSQIHNGSTVGLLMDAAELVRQHQQSRSFNRKWLMYHLPSQRRLLKCSQMRLVTTEVMHYWLEFFLVDVRVTCTTYKLLNRPTSTVKSSRFLDSESLYQTLHLIFLME